MTAKVDRSLNALIWIAYHLEAPELIERYVRMVTDELKSRGHKVTICRELSDAVQAAPDADIMVCWRIVPEIFANAGRLQWIQFGSAGIDHSIFPELLASDVILTNLSGIHRTPISEHVLGLMLSFTRRLHTAMRLQMERRYDRSDFALQSDELNGKTVGIIGLGKIGLELGRICKCLGMTVIATKRTPARDMAYIDDVLSPQELDKVIEKSDFLVLLVPLTNATKTLIGEREIRLMKPGAYVINVARGQMIDEKALIEALRRGTLGGAALDVFAEEPLRPDNPLYDLSNVIITPHVAGSHQSYPDRAFGIFRSNLDAFLSDASMVNVYDRAKGY